MAEIRQPAAIQGSARTERFPSLAHWGAFTAIVEGGRLVRCEPFEHDPAPSTMLAVIPEMVYSPLRIARPAVRKSWLARREHSDRSQRAREPFVEVSWDTALTLVSEELERVRSSYGAAAIFGGSYGWSSAGRLHHARTQVRRFLFAGGGCIDQAGNYSWGAAQFLLPHVIGTYAPVTGHVTDWENIVKHTRLIIAFGGLALKNGQVASGGAGEHTMDLWLRRAKNADIEFAVVSPTRADAPAFLGAQWMALRPNTDAALMLAMMHTLLSEELHDTGFLARYCEGYDVLRRYLLGETDGTPKSAQWAQGITGVAAATIQDLARKAAATRTMITCAWSLQRAHRGEQPYWAAIALASMLGQIGLPGGGFAFGHGSINGVGNPRPDVPGPEMPIGVNPIGKAIPVARIADMLLHPGMNYDFDGNQDTYPDIHMIYWAGGNPFHHHQDLNRLRRAWQKPETVVVHESWWTATARHADIVLPATTTLERNDVGGSSRDRYVLAMKRAIAPIAESRDDFDIFRELAVRGGFEAAYTEDRSEAQWIEEIYTRLRSACQKSGVALPDFNAFWDQGYAELAPPQRSFILFEEFRADPDRHPLQTPSGRIELYSKTIAGFGYDDSPPHPAWLPPNEWLGAAEAARWPLHLITVQPPDRLHAQMDSGPVSRAHKVAGREKIRLHPQDALARGIQAGDVVRVFNQRGACLAGAALDDGLLAGVVVMATGAWFDADDDKLERHGNPNVLTRDIGASKLTQAPSPLSVLVEVEKWNGAVPAMTAWQPPLFIAS